MNETLWVQLIILNGMNLFLKSVNGNHGNRHIDLNGHISNWDAEWYYHLPFPFVGVQWFDIGTHQEIMNGQLIENEIFDHSEKIIELLNKIGLSFDIAGDFIRVWGYLPHCYEKFNE
nr:DUF6678 family protein [Thalassomonas haliotis]